MVTSSSFSMLQDVLVKNNDIGIVLECGVEISIKISVAPLLK